MSYWIYLEPPDNQELVIPEEALDALSSSVPTDWRITNHGGEFNLTYNYSEVYRLFEFNPKDMHGKRAGEQPLLDLMDYIAKKCGTRVYHADGWAPTPGNAGFRMAEFVAWAKANPDAVWEVH